MADSTIHIDLEGNAIEALRALKSQVESMGKTVTDIEKKTSTSFNSIGKSLKALNFVSVTQGFQNVAQGFNDLNAPGLKFTSALADVEAITGVTGKQLELLGQKARESAKEFGGTASDSLESYKTILSRLGPGIGKSQEALEGMERDIRVMSKTMGGDAVGAADALTTAMLQYGVDLSNPLQAQKEMTRMMNVMAAGAKEGAAEVPGISEALKVAGVQAKQSKVSFEETNSALQSLAAGGKQGSEAGTALRNVLGKMAGDDIIPKEASMKLRKLGVDMRIVSDTSLPFTSRLRELKKAQGDATIMAQMFGVENAAAAQILLNSVDAQEELTKKITGTNVAQEQANVVMETQAEKAARLKAKIDDMKISFFNATGGATSLLEPVSQLATTMSAFAPIVSGAWKMVTKFKDVMISAKTPIKEVGTATASTANSLEKSATATSKAGSMMKGLGSVMSGIGWAAVATAIGLVATRIWDVASGAAKAREKMEEFEKGSIKGAKKSEKFTSSIQKDLDRQLENNLNLERSGKISAQERIDNELKIKQIAQAKIKDELAFLTISKNNETKRLNKQKEKQKSAENYGSSLGLSAVNDEHMLSLYGMKNEASKSAMIRGDIASIDAQKKGAYSLLETLNIDVNRQKAEKQGAKNNTSLLAPLTSDTTNSVQGTGEPVKNISVKIDQLVGNITIQTTNISESVGKIKQIVTEALIGGVRDFEVAQ